MNKFNSVALLCGIVHFCSCIDDQRFILTSNSLPDNDRFHPPIGNGHVATNVLSDTIYMNSLFNGREDSSSRARIPSTVAIDVNVTALRSTWSREYSLDMYKGIFQVDVSTPSFKVFIYQFAHRKYNRLLLTLVNIQRQQSGDIMVPLRLNTGGPSRDFQMSPTMDNNTYSYAHGHIVATELDGMPKTELHHYWTKVPETLNLKSGQDSLTKAFVTSLSIAQTDAWRNFDMALKMSPNMLLSEHVTAMSKLWKNGRIEVEDNMDLARDINAAMYNILCSLPSQQDPLIPFYGLSPGGLSRGGLLVPSRPGGGHNDYAGHVFWDMDTWMMPPIMIFHPEMAPMMIGSRTRVMDRVKQNAIESGHVGLKFPWEQGISGIEVTPKWAGNMSRYQIHITADISYSLRQYLYATHDVGILKSDLGLDLALEIARYWKSRTTKTGNDVYEILGVMGPDEYHFNIDNSVYTNYNAKLSLMLPQYIKDYMGIKFNKSVENEIQEFSDIAAKLKILYNTAGNFHPQYEGFSFNVTIKQSDVVLLGYPLMMPMSKQVRRNDLEKYENITNPQGPDTGTWSMHTVGWLELSEEERAAKTFKMMFRNINEPFKVFSEKPVSVSANNTGGCVNFITGAGGLLQSVLFGYGGIRYREDQMDLNPTKLPNTTSWAIRGVKYRGVTFDVDVKGSQISVHFKMLSINKTVDVKLNGRTVDMQQNKTVTFNKQLITIKVRDSGRSLHPTIASATDVPTSARGFNSGNYNCHDKLLQIMSFILLALIELCML